MNAVPTTPAAATPRATVLVVDDTPANLSLLSNVLNKLYRVQVATSGHKALEIAARQPPDLIVLDVMMPELDGYEVCRRLKADPRTQAVPVLFLTALTRAEDETRGFEVGGADFIHKPFNPATVQARVHTHLQLKSLLDASRQRAQWLQGELEEKLRELEASIAQEREEARMAMEKQRQAFEHGVLMGGGNIVGHGVFSTVRRRLKAPRNSPAWKPRAWSSG